MNVGKHSNPESDTFKQHDRYLGAARGPHLAKCFKAADLNGLLSTTGQVSRSFPRLCVLPAKGRLGLLPPSACLWLLLQMGYLIICLATCHLLTHKLKGAFPLHILLRST